MDSKLAQLVHDLSIDLFFALSSLTEMTNREKEHLISIPFTPITFQRFNSNDKSKWIQHRQNEKTNDNVDGDVEKCSIWC